MTENRRRDYEPDSPLWWGIDPNGRKRPHVTIRADGGATYDGLNGAAMGR